MIKLMILTFGLVVLVCAVSGGAEAQTGPVCIGWVSCSSMSLSYAACEPPLPPGATNCTVEVLWTVVCEVVLDNCGAPPVWCPECGKWVPAGGAPINLTNGNTYIQEADVRIPGLGGGLQLQRNWNSIWPGNASPYQTGLFGLGWRSTYEERVFTGSGDAVNYFVYLRSDGGLWYFNSNGNLVAPANVAATLTLNGTESWTIAFQNGETRVFSYATGTLTAIVDRNGNTTQMTYDSLGRLVTVTDPASRHLYFSYASGSSYLVTGVTSDVSVSTSYSYDSQGRLAQVTEPDQSTLTFQYNSQSLISSVTDSNGKTLEAHTYDSNGRGLTSSRANGVDGVTVSYAQ